MEQRPRGNRISRRSWLLAGLAIPLFRARASASLSATFDGDNLYPAVPSLHFLTDKLLERLRKSADTQAFVSHVTIFSDDRGTIFRQQYARFIVSYAIWEEKLKVAIPGPAARSKEGLTQAQAEQWCLENLGISASGLAMDRPFRLRLELRAVAQRDLSRVLGNTGISISDPVVEFFSRRAEANELHLSLDTGPLRLLDLPRLSGRPAQNG